MTRTEAIEAFISTLGDDDAVRNVRRCEDADDGTAWWEASVIDAFTGEKIGEAMIYEHHPVVDVTWVR